ncbi:hypothetical protein [Nocardia sp. bgisy134]|uniref:hypothetical protein n=1 Tax=unclassified Nocardia TaxID=2637762 RepID=UPI003D73A436
MRSPDQPHAKVGHNASWVRTALHQCHTLETGKSFDPHSKSVVVFAIRWAPFGGATTEEVFLNFGVSRQRFLHMVSDALSPRRSDNQRNRQLKKYLLQSLNLAWGANPILPPPSRITT